MPEDEGVGSDKFIVQEDRCRASNVDGADSERFTIVSRSLSVSLFQHPYVVTGHVGIRLPERPAKTRAMLRGHMVSLRLRLEF
jgi:hypothetical protein